MLLYHSTWKTCCLHMMLKFKHSSNWSWRGRAGDTEPVTIKTVSKTTIKTPLKPPQWTLCITLIEKMLTQLHFPDIAVKWMVLRVTQKVSPVKPSRNITTFKCNHQDLTDKRRIWQIITNSGSYESSLILLLFVIRILIFITVDISVIFNTIPIICTLITIIIIISCWIIIIIINLLLWFYSLLSFL